MKVIVCGDVFLCSDLQGERLDEVVLTNSLEGDSMKSFRLWCLGSSLVLALTLGTDVTAQEKKAESAKASAKADAKAGDVAKKGVNRLPNYFGKLGLSEDQKTKVLAVQETYAAQIADLNAKLKVLEDKRDAEFEAVLQPEQVKQLVEARAAAKKKADDKKAADKAKSATTESTVVEPAKKVEADVKKPEEPAKKAEATKK